MPEPWLAAIAACALAYLAGSIPTGYLWARAARGIDIRRHGSGNIGATNVARVLGSRAAGVSVFLLDVGKGWVPVALYEGWAAARWPLAWPVGGYAAGLSAVAGHCWPVWLAFRGGKGVATALGVVAALFPAAAGLSLAAWILAAAATRYVSVSSVLAAALFPAWLALGFSPWALSTARGRSGMAFAALCAAAVIWRHRGNLRRLREGTEPRIGRKDPGESP